MGKLQEGIYAKLITKSIMQQVADAGGLAVTNACPNKETFVKLVAHEISDEIKRYLSDKLEKIDDDSISFYLAA